MFKKAVVILAIILALSFLIQRTFFSKISGPVFSPKGQGEKTTKITVTPTQIPATNQEELLKKVKKLFFEANPDIDFAITVCRLKDNSCFGYNDGGAQHAASVSKILTAAYLLKKVEEGEVDVNEKMGTYNIEFNLKQLVNQSNNISWRMIDNLLGIDPQNEFAHSLGLTSFDLHANLISPKDVAMLFVKLYRGEILTEPYQRKLFSYMQNTETENLIPPAIPKEVPLYHKSGLYNGEVHDVAIVDHPEHPFVLAIFTSNKLYPDYEGRAQLIQKVTSEIYAHLTL